VHFGGAFGVCRDASALRKGCVSVNRRIGRRCKDGDAGYKSDQAGHGSLSVSCYAGEIGAAISNEKTRSLQFAAAENPFIE
jgi:hypothetical protein